jgi:hypothetical protein
VAEQNTVPRLEISISIVNGPAPSRRRIWRHSMISPTSRAAAFSPESIFEAAQEDVPFIRCIRDVPPGIYPQFSVTGYQHSHRNRCGIERSDAGLKMRFDLTRPWHSSCFCRERLCDTLRPQRSKP